jgi:hypothetical protein
MRFVVVPRESRFSDLVFGAATNAIFGFLDFPIFKLHVFLLLPIFGFS